MPINRQTWTWIWSAVLAIVLTAAALFAYGWYRQVDPLLHEVRLSPSDPELGELITVDLELTLGWHQSPRPLQVQLPEGLDLVDEAQVERLGWGLGTWRCRSRIGLRAYRPGEYEELPASLRIAGTGLGERGSFDLTIAGFTVQPLALAEDEQIKLAGQLSEDYLINETPRPWWQTLLLIAGLLVAALLVIWLLIRLGRRTAAVAKQPDPWEVALTNLADLEDRLPVEPDEGFQEVTDILRRYLEDAYKVPATEQTTDEFLRTLNQKSSRLDEEQRAMLGDFLSTADLIKFARGEADLAQMQEAIDKARAFVLETSEQLMAARRQQEAAHA